MRVRKHRGSLADSMMTEATVHNQAELDAYFGFPVHIAPESIYDERIGWDTHYVLDSQGRAVGTADAGGFAAGQDAAQ